MILQETKTGYKETPLFEKRGGQIVQNISNNVLTGNLYYQASTTFSAAGCKYQSLLSAPLLVTQARNSG